jgi:hypothetical protein
MLPAGLSPSPAIQPHAPFWRGFPYRALASQCNRLWVGLPHQHKAVGKSDESTIRLDARHVAGSLQITITDEGAGIDLDELREVVVRRKLTAANMIVSLADAELLEFLRVLSVGRTALS